MATPTMTLQLDPSTCTSASGELILFASTTGPAVGFATATGLAIAGVRKDKARPLRTVADGVLNSTTTVTSATAAFTYHDIGRGISGTGIPAGAYITSVTSTTTVVISSAATATATSVTLTLGTLGLLVFRDLNPNSGSSDDVIDDPTGTAWRLVVSPNSSSGSQAPVFFYAPDTAGFHDISSNLATEPGALLPSGVVTELVTLVEDRVGELTEAADLPEALETVSVADDFLIVQDGGLVRSPGTDVLDRANHTGELPFADVPAAALDRDNHTGTTPYTAISTGPRMQWRASVNQGIPNNTWTALGFNTLDANVGGLGAHVTASTTIAAGSNGAVLPQATINVASTAGFPSSGAILINGPSAASTTMIVAYTGVTATSFTGCAGGAGTLATGQVVTPANNVVTITELGVYQLSGSVAFASNGTGRRGIRFLASSILPVGELVIGNIGAFQHTLTTSTTFSVTAVPATIQLHVFQVSGATLNSLTDNINAPRLSIDYLHALGT